MNITISGRNIDITPSLRETVMDKLGKLDRYFTPDTDVNVTLSVEKERQKIERQRVAAMIDNAGGRRKKRGRIDRIGERAHL